MAHEPRAVLLGSPAAVAWPIKRSLEFGPHEFFAEGSRTFSQCGFDRLKPIVSKGTWSTEQAAVFVVLLVMAWSPIQRFNAG
jgi:hypothetical protein